jgi:hypothetical protein
MAQINVNSPFGFRPMLFNLDGGPSRVSQYCKLVGDTYAIFCNDLVTKVASSAVPLEGGTPAPGCKSGYNGTPGTSLWLGSSLNYGLASTQTFHSIIDSPTAVFIAQTDSSVVEDETIAAGKNANLSIAVGGSTTVAKLSGMQINTSSIATTAGLDLRLLNAYDEYPNVDNLANEIFEVVIMKHQYAMGSAGV